MTTEALAQARAARVETAARLGKPDRVPFVPMISGFYALGYGISFYDVMKDPRSMKPGFEGFLRDYEPDAVSMPGLYNIGSLEALDTTFIRWPGPGSSVPPNVSFQHLDLESLEEDEYDEFIADPTHTILTKMLPRKHGNLKGLAKLDFHDIYDKNLVDSFAVLCDPEVRAALDAMAEAGRSCMEFRARMGEATAAMREWGFPSFCEGSIVIPFDSFADSARGIINTTMDLITCPDKLERAVSVLTDLTLERQIKAAAARGARRIVMPLHTGVDEFMSPANYEKYYWPNLKKAIDLIIANGMTPICFCEGNYNTRLELLCDVPKGKVIYIFEKVDLQRAKDTVGQVACICGNLSNALLAFGKPEEVEYETRRQIDILAPGGGYIMNCSATLDNANHKNMHIWRDTTLKYGVY